MGRPLRRWSIRRLCLGQLVVHPSRRLPHLRDRCVPLLVRQGPSKAFCCSTQFQRLVDGLEAHIEHAAIFAEKGAYGSQEAIGFAEGPAVSASMLPSECSPAPCRASLPPDRQPCQSMQAPRLAPIHRNISEYVRYEIGNERTLTATAGRAAHYAVVGSARSSVLTIDASAPMNAARCFAGSASRIRSSTRFASGSAVRSRRWPSSVSLTA